MTKLEDIIENHATDKNTTHSYLPVYQELFEEKQLSATNVLEIGLGHGGSIKLWNDYFPNADIYCLDINTSWGVRCNLNSPRIHLQLRDAYTEECVSSFQAGSFDIIVDDGPHTLESMVFTVEKYSSLLKPDGILVVEDIPKLEWAETLKKLAPNTMMCEIHDRRSLKGRFDDILLVGKQKNQV